MNTENGALYYGDSAIRDALLRGEPVVEVSEQVADLIEAGRRARQPAPSSLPTLYATGYETDMSARLRTVEEKLAALERKKAATVEGLIILPSPEEVRQFAGHERAFRF